MENLLGSILSQLNKDTIQKMGSQLNASPSATQKAINSALPLIMGALARNNSTPEGKKSLESALQRDHDGSILGHLNDLLQNPEAANGAGILKHVLGNRRGAVENYVAKESGLAPNSTGKILEMLAPIVMGYLGKQSTTGQQAQNPVGSLLEGFLKNQGGRKGSSGIINQLLDQNNDGSISDDIARMGMNALGKMFKKK